MYEYDFTLRFAIKNIDPAECADTLYGNGCDDALIGIGSPGYIALNFIREAPTAFDAITSAISDVRRTLPKSPLIEASPDLGGISDIAALMDCTRQNVRKLITSDNNCPPPVHKGSSPIWHMSEVLSHLNSSRGCKINPEIIDLTSVIRQVNTQNFSRQEDASFRGLYPNSTEYIEKITELVNA